MSEGNEVCERVAALLAPISDAVPPGVFDPEHPLYQAIDDEMVKLGGLQSASLDWTRVETQATQYLREESKHFRVLAHLCAAWGRTREWRDWIASLQLLAGMVQTYWLSGFPQAGADGLQAKRKQWSAVSDRLWQTLKTLPPESFTGALPAQATEAVDRLEHAERQHALTPSLVDRLRPALTQAAEAARRTPYAAPAATRSATTSPAGHAIDAAFFTTRSDSPLGNERETRRLYLKLAEYINQLDAYEPTGYLLRRYALWSGVHATPPIKRERRTEMLNVPADITHEYHEQVSGRSHSPALLLRIEKSVAASPFWLRGSFLAATVAQRLEIPVVAMAIRTAVERFVRRLPTLRDLEFADGTPFIDAETLAWLSGASETAPSAHGSTSLAAPRTQMQSQAEDEGVDAVLHRLQASQISKTTARDRHLASIAAADALAAHGVTWLAQDLYAGVAQTMRSHTAAEWEPDVFDYVVARSPARSAT